MTVNGTADWATTFADRQKQHEALRAQRSRVEGEANQVERTLEEARRRAREQFGTDDPNKLEEMAREIDAKNEQAANEFIQSVDRVKAALAADSAPGMGMGG